MIVAIRNVSRIVPPERSAVVAAACRIWLARLCEAWRAPCPEVRHYTDERAIPVGAFVATISDAVDEPGLLAYHSVSGAGLPYAAVGARGLDASTLTRGPLSLSARLTHEAGEATFNPRCDRWATGPDGIVRAYEVCDPVEADVVAVTVDGEPVDCSDAVLPAYYDARAEGPWDLAGVLAKPWSLALGGYENVLADDGSIGQRWGAEPTAEARAAKASGRALALGAALARRDWRC